MTKKGSEHLNVNNEIEESALDSRLLQLLLLGNSIYFGDSFYSGLNRKSATSGPAYLFYTGWKMVRNNGQNVVNNEMVKVRSFQARYNYWY